MRSAAPVETTRAAAASASAPAVQPEAKVCPGPAIRNANATSAAAAPDVVRTKSAGLSAALPLARSSA
jgi:hypothetical protein